MASIGELTATVRADVSGFVGPMQQVVTTTQRTASQVQSIIQPTQQLGQSLGQTATAGKLFGVSLGSLRGSLASLVSGLAGVPGPLGNIASKFAMFGAGGGVTVAVLAGITALVAGWRSLTQETRDQEAAVDDLVASYNEMFGATVRLRREQALQAVEDAKRGRLQILPGTTGPFGMPLVTRLQDTQELIRAQQALQAAERAYAEHNRKVMEPGLRAAADAANAYAAALDATEQAVKNAKDKSPTNTRQKVEEVAEIFDLRKPKGGDKTGTEQAVQGARDAAQAMSQAFMAAFTESKEAIGDRIASVLRSAIQGAIQRLIEEKLFDALLKAFSPDKGIVSGGILPNIPIIGGILGGLGLAPPMPAAGGTIIVPLDALPPALSPVEVARDVQHQTLWMETARVAEANGFRLVPRFR